MAKCLSRQHVLCAMLWRVVTHVSRARLLCQPMRLSVYMRGWVGGWVGGSVCVCVGGGVACRQPSSSTKPLWSIGQCWAEI